MRIISTLIGLLFWAFAAKAQFTQIGPQLDGNAPNDNFGYAVAMDATGNTIAVGAPLYDNDFGQVRVYTELGEVWTQLGQDIEGTEIGNQYGFSLAMSANGRRLAVGGIGAGPTNGGQVRIYQYSAGQWSLLGTPIAATGAGDQMGTSVAMSADGQRIVVGAPQYDGLGPNTGQVKVFEFSGGDWTQLGGDLEGDAFDDEFGVAVSMSQDGQVIAASSIKHSGAEDQTGQVKVYVWENNEWVQRGSDIEGNMENEFVGGSVDLDETGTRIVVGAAGFFHNDGFGAVRVYEWNGMVWNQLGDDIIGNSNMEAFGQTVVIDKFGLRILVGTQSADEFGISSGRVNLFEWVGNGWLAWYSPVFGQAQFDFLGFSAALNDSANRFVLGANLANSTQGYAVIYEDSNDPVSIEHPFEGPNVHIWWEQDGHTLHLQSEQPLVGYTLELIDIQGRILLSRDLPNLPDFAHYIPLAAGQYIVRLTGKGQLSQKINVRP